MFLSPGGRTRSYVLSRYAFRSRCTAPSQYLSVRSIQLRIRAKVYCILTALPGVSSPNTHPIQGLPHPYNVNGYMLPTCAMSPRSTATLQRCLIRYSQIRIQFKVCCVLPTSSGTSFPITIIPSPPSAFRSASATREMARSAMVFYILYHLYHLSFI